jgi:hypothetical protein
MPFPGRRNSRKPIDHTPQQMVAPRLRCETFDRGQNRIDGGSERLGGEPRERRKPASFLAFPALTPPTRTVTNRALFRQAVSFPVGTARPRLDP